MKHIVHTVDPLLAYLPVSQAVHVEAVVAPALTEYLPSPQLVHADTALALTLPEYVPALQFLHCETLLAPGVSEYVPTLQLRHTVEVVAPTVTEYLPALQLMHCKMLLAPRVFEYVPATQLVHTAVPGKSLYFPVSHCVHVPPLDPVKPALQVQSVITKLAASEFEFSGHDAHSLAPVTPEYLPGTQFTHDDAPAAEYFPGSQFAHSATETQVCPHVTAQLRTIPGKFILESEVIKILIPVVEV